MKEYLKDRKSPLPNDYGFQMGRPNLVNPTIHHNLLNNAVETSCGLVESVSDLGKKEMKYLKEMQYCSRYITFQSNN